VLAESLQSLLLQSLDFLVDSIEIFGTFFVILGLDETETLVARSEPGKKEGEGWMLEEALLSLLAILIHGISH